MSQSMMSVSSLNTKIKSLLEATFIHIMVEGEIASVTYHSSGHIYFSIKDDTSSVRCVLWRSNVARLKFRLEKGEHIVIEGSVGVYTPRGEYQFIATHVEPYGKGTLAVAFEQLKKKLKSKGYFDAHTKQTIPSYVSRMALVTAASGAALQDMLKVAQKRWSVVEIVVIDVLVQGTQASGEIARGIAYADTLAVDVIVIGRGGGSTEDLWAFNEERVADAIHEASTPIVSAVGHEVDTLISDFVADVRAPTPSAAIEMILPDSNELLYALDERVTQIKQRVSHLVLQREERLVRLRDEMNRASVMSKLIQIEKQFTVLRGDFAKTIKYRLSHFLIKIVPEKEKIEEGIRAQLRKKIGDTSALKSRLELANPAKQSKFAWAQITVEGIKKSLKNIDIGDEFDIVDAEYKLKVKSLKKEKLI